MQEATFESLFRQEIEDLYDAEQQILAALPRLADAASTGDLADAFREHLEETRMQVKRLDEIFKSLGAKPGGKPCEGMRGLIAEGEKLMAEIPKSPVLDVALAAAAQKVEHYEIAGYNMACSLAEMFGHDDAAELLVETLEEERDTDETLTEIAGCIMAGDDLDEEEEQEDEAEVEEEA